MNKPTFTINGMEFEFGCELSHLLSSSGLQIAEIDTYLHYNKKALIVQPGKTRNWELEDSSGNRFKVTIFNPSNQEITSESCKVVAIDFDANIKYIDLALISDQIKIGIQAKDIVNILGSVSGRSENEDVNSYWWNWHPYKNSDEQVSIYVNANKETGEVVYIKAEVNYSQFD
jgi:hypothetical protein